MFRVYSLGFGVLGFRVFRVEGLGLSEGAATVNVTIILCLLVVFQNKGTPNFNNPVPLILSDVAPPLSPPLVQ